jgi:energy-coupling factor transporter ATP-binding protein EcfA2
VPRINSLKIHKLGNVAPGTELRFGSKGAVLLGKNGTGKTTLLDALVNICNCDLGLLSNEDYDLEFSMSCAGDVELHVTARSEKADAGSSGERASNPVADAMFSSLQERARRHTLRIEALHTASGDRTLLESNDRETACTLPDGRRVVEPISVNDGWLVLATGASAEGGLTPLGRACLDLFWHSRVLRRFDEGLDYFRDLTERSLTSACVEFTQIDDAGTLADERGFSIRPAGTRLLSLRCAQFFANDFQHNKDRATSSSISSSEVKYLELFCRLTGFTQAQIGADLDEKRLVNGREVVTLSPLRFTVTRNGSTLHHRHLSFGQRRLLAFLHYFDSTPSLLMADELVNGMHHEWISACVHLMEDAQAFLSSQNPLLFDFLTFESAEDVASRFVSCELDEQHRFVWRNMSEDDAREFYETHKAGLQHASEILRTRGYW